MRKRQSFSSPLERSPEPTPRSNTFRGRQGDPNPSNAPSPPVSAALPNLMASWGGGTFRTHRGQVVDRDDHRRAGSDIRGSPASEKGGGYCVSRCSGAVHHGPRRLYPPRLGSVHGEPLWGGYFRGPGAYAFIFRAPDVQLRLELREGGLGARRRTDKRTGAPAFGAGSSGPGDGTESRRRGRTTSECASAKFFPHLSNAALSQRRGPRLSGDVRGIETRRTRAQSAGLRRSPELDDNMGGGDLQDASR
jgi:hypothetical protein